MRSIDRPAARPLARGRTAAIAVRAVVLAVEGRELGVVERLDAEADPRDAVLGEHGERSAVEALGVGFDGPLAAGGERMPGDGRSRTAARAALAVRWLGVPPPK